MICPRCGREISDSETLCPFCFQDIDKNIEFNDFRKDGFIQVSIKDDADTSSAINYMPKYFDLSEFSMLVIAVVFILVVSVFTLFSLRFVQKVTTYYDLDYVFTTDPETETVTETTTVHYLENISIKDLYGNWRLNTGVEESEFNAVPYYSFGENGKVVEYLGTIAAGGVYKDLSEGEDHIVYINIDAGVKGTFNYSMTEEDGIYTLVITEIRTGSLYTFTKVANAKIVTLRHEEDAEPVLDSRLFGYWVSKDKEKSYKFARDGRVVRGTGKIKTGGIWDTHKKDMITIQYMKETIKAIDLEFKQKGNKLKINNVIYYKTATK